MSEIKVGDAEIRRVEEMPIQSPMWVLTKDQALIDANRHVLHLVSQAQEAHFTGDVFHGEKRTRHSGAFSETVCGLGASEKWCGDLRSDDPIKPGLAAVLHRENNA
jgi:hypothetical protein